jgi:drug/metabolite transporter (DMT)-like permease
MLLAGAFALAIGAPFPGIASVRWALAAGSVGGLALAVFYRSLAAGQMGLVAPVAAVLGAAIPTTVTAFSEGVPDTRHLFGFVLAGIGVWLISRAETADTGAESGGGSEKESEIGSSAGNGPNRRRPKGIGMAVLAGCGFAGFYLCIHQAGNGSALWLSVCSRLGSLLVTLVFVAFARQFRTLPRLVLAIAVAAGILDISGSVVFVRASQIGRLDVAVVLSSLYPAVTVILARIFLHEHFSRARTLGMLAALAAVPMIAG